MYEAQSNTEKLAALIDTSDPKKIKSSIYKLKINPGEVVIAKDNSLDPGTRQLIARAFAQYHRHALLIFLPESATLETLPIEQVKDILSSINGEHEAAKPLARVKRLFKKKG